MVFTFKRSQSTNQLFSWFKSLVQNTSCGPFRNLNRNVGFSLGLWPPSEGSQIYRIASEGKKGAQRALFRCLMSEVLMAHHVKNPGRWPHQGPGPLGSWSCVGLDQSRDPFWLEKMRALDPFCVEW